jgi:hypothetical protein
MVGEGSPTPTNRDRCVAVVGMGRSGTSATAGLLVKLGLSGPRPDDLIPASSANESGHWESRGMHRYNARLLAAVGATGYGPPQVMARWDGVRNYNEIHDAASSWFATTYVGKPMMVKDPRLCVTLPFWRDVLPKSMAAVFVLRDPVRVARSLEARDDIPMTLALAVWDRYVRSAAVVLQGLPTLVVEYDEMLADPQATTKEICAFLRQVGVEVPPEAAEGAEHHLDSTLRHQSTKHDDYDDLAKVQRQVFETLVNLRGSHDEWAPVQSILPAPPPWVEDMLAMQRRYIDRVRELRRLRSSTANRVGAALGRLTGRHQRSAEPA